MEFETGKRNSNKIEIPHDAHGPVNHSFTSPLNGTSFSVQDRQLAHLPGP